MKFRFFGSLIILLTLVVTILEASEPNDGGWMERVPPSEHARTSPIRNKAVAIANGRSTFRTHCSPCHGENAQGSDRAPALRTARVQRHATQGDLHWLVANGNRERGMPAWAKLGDHEIWQVIAYVRSLR